MTYDTVDCFWIELNFLCLIKTRASVRTEMCRRVNNQCSVRVAREQILAGNGNLRIKSDKHTRGLSQLSSCHLPPTRPHFLRLLINKSRAPLWFCNHRLLFILKAPPIQIPGPNTQICRETQPPKVRSKAPSRNLVNLSPNVRHVADRAGESKDVDGSGNGCFIAEEERHPDEVERELDRVECCAVLNQDQFSSATHANACSESNSRSPPHLRQRLFPSVHISNSGRPGPVSRITHPSVQRRPHRPKNPRWRSKRWLTEGEIRFLRFRGTH